STIREAVQGWSPGPDERVEAAPPPTEGRGEPRIRPGRRPVSAPAGAERGLGGRSGPGGRTPDGVRSGRLFMPFRGHPISSAMRSGGRDAVRTASRTRPARPPPRPEDGGGAAAHPDLPGPPHQGDALRRCPDTPRRRAPMNDEGPGRLPRASLD